VFIVIKYFVFGFNEKTLSYQKTESQHKQILRATITALTEMIRSFPINNARSPNE